MPVIRNYTEKEQIFIFDSDLDERSSYDPHHLETLKTAEESHFWFSARQEKICQLFQSHVKKQASILEIGGGTGFIAEKLMKLGYSIEIGDIHHNGLQYAKRRGVKKLYQFDLFKPPFEKEYDVICLFDVFEHLQNELQALECLKTMLKSGGKIILTVPAHQWLWSRDDHIAGHKRRYTKEALEKLFKKAQLKPLLIRYFFVSILPLLLMRRWLRKETNAPLLKNQSINLSIHPFFNHGLRLLTKAEFYLDKYLPNKIGGSLVAIASL